MTDRSFPDDDPRKKSGPGSEPGPEDETEKGQEKMPKDIKPDECAQEKGSFTAEPEKPSAPEGKTASVDELPAVRDYLNRIGARCTSMFRAAITEQAGKYKNELAQISFAKDGEVKVRLFSDALEDVEPTEVEEAAIKAAITQATFIGIKTLDRVIDLPPMMLEAQQKDAHRPWPKYFHEFRDAAGQIVMVQTRLDLPEGDEREKLYLEWTFWDDNKWRCQRPEKLPLWGQSQLRNHSTVFLHEGAKTAAYCAWLTSDRRDAVEARAAHPWGDELMGAAHLGWVGGAPSPHLTEWAVLAKAGVTRVIVAPDEDKFGKRAVQQISRHLAGVKARVSRISYGDRFPMGFDLADDLPARFIEGGKYTGPSLREMTFPATWATRKVMKDKGRPEYVMRDEFAEDWAVITGEGNPIFVPRQGPPRKLSESSFNDRAKPYSDVHNLGPKLLEFASSQFDALAYRPGETAERIPEESTELMNTWRGPTLRGNPNGDASPWENYLEHLIPDETDRANVKRWLATLIARPDIRMKYGMLLLSEMQGTGKSTLGTILKKVLGHWNVSEPGENDVVKSDNNDWLAEKQLVFVNEIYAGHGWAAYNKLKTYVTDPVVHINKKYVPQYSIENWAHFILCSNETQALSMSHQDRRFFVPEVTENLRDPQDWVRLHLWLAEDGPAIIARWAKDYVREHGEVTVNGLPPMNERKQQLIADTKQSIDRDLADLAGAARLVAEQRNLAVGLVDKEVEGWLKQRHSPMQKPLHALRKGLVREGLSETKAVTLEANRKRQLCVTDPALVEDFDAPTAKEIRMSPELVMKEAGAEDGGGWM